MSRSQNTARPLQRLALPWLGPALALTLAIGVGVLLAQLLMAPPGGELRTLAGYLALSGAVTLAGGWLALRLADRLLGLSIQAKTFLSSVIGGGVALLNVFIVAQLMFISTSHDLQLLVALLVFSAVVTAAFSMWVAATVAGRLSYVTAAIRSLAAGHYSARVAAEGRDEIGRLAEDVNSLARRLQATEEQRATLERERRELTAAVSHDLRTPLASVRAMVEALDDQLVDKTEVGRYYETIRREIERLSRMIDDLFELAQVDAGALRLDKRPLALHEIAAEVVDAMQAQARLRDIMLSLAIAGEQPEAPLDGGRIERVVMNLLRNALEHTPAGGRVEVKASAENGWVSLSVSDTGPGIDEADLPYIWDRFYRAEKSRRRGTQSSDGAGLGLATVRGIVEAHGGQVNASSPPGGGAVLTVRLPT